MRMHVVYALLLCLLSLLAAPAAIRAETDLEAGLGLALEYNDNIDSSATRKRSDFISHIKPSFSFKNDGGRVGADISYRGDYQFYLQGKGDRDFAHYIDVSADAELWENLLFVTVGDSMSPVYRDLTQTTDFEDDTTRNMVNKNNFYVSPYITLHPGESSSLSIGYTFTDTRYSKNTYDSRRHLFPSDSEDYNFNRKKSQQHAANINFSRELSDRAAFYLGGDITRWKGDGDEYEEEDNFYRYQAYIGSRYEFSENLSADIRVGPSYVVPDEGSSSTKPYVQGSVVYSVGRSTLTGTYVVLFDNNPDSGTSKRVDSYGLNYTKLWDRSTLTIASSYKKYSNETDDSRTTDTLGNNFTPSISLNHELTERQSLFMRCSAILYRDRDEGNNQYTGHYGIKHLLDENAWISLSHTYKKVDPDKTPSYTINRVMLDFYYGF